MLLWICTGICQAVPLLICTMPKDLVNDDWFPMEVVEVLSGLSSFVVFPWHSMGRRQEYWLMHQESSPRNNSNRPLILMSGFCQPHILHWPWSVECFLFSGVMWCLSRANRRCSAVCWPIRSVTFLFKDLSAPPPPPLFIPLFAIERLPPTRPEVAVSNKVCLPKVPPTSSLSSSQLSLIPPPQPLSVRTVLCRW